MRASQQDHDHAEAPAYRAAQDDDARRRCHYQGGDDRYRVTPPPPGDYDPDAYYAEDGHMPPQQGEESRAGNRRRGGCITIAAVLGLAVIGTAGAFGYRAFTSGSGAPANPPVIKADTTPAKIVPPRRRDPARKRAGQAVPGSHRRGRRRAERIVSREEQPVALPTAARAPVGASRRFAPAASAPLVPPQPSARRRRMSRSA